MTLKLAEDLVTAIEGEQTYDRTASEVPPEVRSAVRRVMAEEFDPEMEIALQELVVADYIVFLLALDTYMRYLTERFGSVDVTDPIVKQGINLLRIAERMHLDAVKTFIQGNLTSPASLRLLEAAVRPPPTAAGASRRALLLRTVLGKNGTTTTRAVFGSSNKARREVQDAIEASMMEDEDAALNKFSALILRNKRLEKWIDKASEAAQPDSTILNSVSVATKGSSDAVQEILKERVNSEGESPSTQDASDSSERQAERLLRVEDEAREAASKVLNRSGEEDRPLTKSEVVGVATAIATAIIADPELPANIPPTLKGLDPEQMAAALSQGKVLVAAGAGSGKTSTLTSRLAYLVKDVGVSPQRIMAICFNKKAANEIRERVSLRAGDEYASQMTIGTMHSTFAKFVREYGTPEEKAAVSTWLIGGGGDDEGKDKDKKTSRAPTPGAMGGYMARLWKICFDEDAPKGMTTKIQKWVMNDITPAMVREVDGDTAEAGWYEWYLGFKGVGNKRWEPPCVRNDEKASKQWHDFLTKYRNNGQARLGDFGDQILIFRNILKRDPSVRKKIQEIYDHIAVDEAQDLNEVQHQIVEMISEHVGCDDKQKSLFLIGDEIQSINSFAGARPDLFTKVASKDCFKVRSIATNYRCLPEIIELSNKLMEHHPRGLPMTARPNPNAPRGAASIVFDKPESHAAGAIHTVTQIAQEVQGGADISNYAVLVRNNMEINDFETACIIQGLPYARRGSTSFLGSPETITVMSYFNLAVGQDFARLQKSFIEIFNKPKRFFMSNDAARKVAETAISNRARALRVDVKSINPLDLFDEEGIQDMIQLMNPPQAWQVRGIREQLVQMGQTLNGARETALSGKTVDFRGEEKAYTTQDLISDILAIKGVPEGRERKVETLRDQLMPQSFSDEAEADNPEDAKEKPVGNVQFLYQIAQATGKADDPSVPLNFKARIDELVVGQRDLRVNVDAWDMEQGKVTDPSQRKAAPCVTLSTVHKVKGAQWKNVTVVMAQGVFPHKSTLRGSVVEEDEADPDLLEARLAFLTERQLAYVAFTRAAENLTVLSPQVTAYGKAVNDDPPFIKEAGFQRGQNVDGKNDPRDIEPPEPGTKTVLAWARKDSSDHGHDYSDAPTVDDTLVASSTSLTYDYSFDRRKS